MRKAYLVISLFLFVGLAAFQVVDECDTMSLKKDLKEQLKPDYKYDSSKTTKFSYKSKVQQKEIEVPLYRGEKYRFLFNMSGISKQGVEVKIYNKPIDNSKRELLYELKPEPGKLIYTFEPEKSRKMYIDYTIPEVENPTENKDCLVFVLGYKLKITL